MPKRAPIILEFNGIPGTGKTTIANELSKLLEHEGFSVKLMYYHRIWERYHYPFLIIPFSPHLYKLVCMFSNSIKPFRKRTHQSSVLFFVRNYIKAQKYCDSDFLLIDQGIVQDLNTIAWLDRLLDFNKKKLSTVIEAIKKKGVLFHRIDCLNNIELSMERIKKRPPKNHYFEDIPSEQLNEALLTQSANFNYIRSICNEVLTNQKVITIDTSLLPKENALIIKDFVCSILENSKK